MSEGVVIGFPITIVPVENGFVIYERDERRLGEEQKKWVAPTLLRLTDVIVQIYSRKEEAQS